MRGFALAAPVVVLVMVHLLQRLEVWATESGRRAVGRAARVGEADSASPPLRQTRVSLRRMKGEASDHG
jgi:hypothetical protein